VVTTVAVVSVGVVTDCVVVVGVTIVELVSVGVTTAVPFAASGAVAEVPVAGAVATVSVSAVLVPAESLAAAVEAFVSDVSVDDSCPLHATKRTSNATSGNTSLRIPETPLEHRCPHGRQNLFPCVRLRRMQRQWTYFAAVAALTLLACIRVASTWRVFSETLDEPVHLAAGYQWFVGPYTVDPSHPPLARALCALPLWLAGYPNPKATDDTDKGNELLYHGDRYEKTLARARAGNLPLLILACAAVALWARRAFSQRVAILAVALFTNLPPILGHAGLVTTDLAVAATLPFALYALDRFLELATPRRAALLGLAIGLGVLSKMSFIVYFPATAVVLVIARWRPRVAWKPVLIALAVAFFVTWGGYRFSFGRPVTYGGDFATYVFDQMAPVDALRVPLRWIANEVPMPAPALPIGLGIVAVHDRGGHGTYLLGRYSDKGWWYYFPVVFFYKTPIPFLLLLAWGIALLVRERDRVRLAYVGAALAILLVAMHGKINIGIRHLLPIYAPLAIVAAHAVAEIWRRATDAFGRTALVALLAWLFIGVAIEHPDYLAWFNEAARPDPSRITVDSNLDWGQDVLRLARVYREMHLEGLHTDIFTNAKLERHGVPQIDVHAGTKVTGWLAVSDTAMIFKQRWGEYAWLRMYRPVRRIGKSIRLYYIE